MISRSNEQNFGQTEIIFRKFYFSQLPNTQVLRKMISENDLLPIQTQPYSVVFSFFFFFLIFFCEFLSYRSTKKKFKQKQTQPPFLYAVYPRVRLFLIYTTVSFFKKPSPFSLLPSPHVCVLKILSILKRKNSGLISH